jgi:hypothetical protein
MKRFAAMLTLILALPGCVQDKPAPRLDSSDRNERIEAVRHAQNRYGVPAQPAENIPAQLPPLTFVLPVVSLSDIALTGEKLRIAGRWHRWGKKDVYFQFNADGAFEDVTELNTTTGRWRFVFGDTIELSALKYSNLLLFWAPSCLNLEYRLQDNELWVNGTYTSSEWVGFARAADKGKQP